MDIKQGIEQSIETSFLWSQTNSKQLPHGVKNNPNTQTPHLPVFFPCELSYESGTSRKNFPVKP
jgi:hypothetical protein